MSLTLLKKSFLSTQNSPNIYTNHSYITLICHSREMPFMRDFPAQIFQLFPPTALNELVRVGPQKCIKRWNPLC